jgi:hypothetical protein
MAIETPASLYVGTWEKNKAESDDYTDVLEVQGVNWMTRKLLSAAGLTMEITWDPETMMLNEKSTTIGISDVQLLNFDGLVHDAKHALFGDIKLSTVVSNDGLVVVKGSGGKSTEWNSITTWCLENNNSKWIRTVEFSSKKLKKTFKYVFDRK